MSPWCHPFILAAATLGASHASAQPAPAQPSLPVAQATVLVLDASGSMWGELADGRAKITVARDVLAQFMATRDAAGPLGVIAYGHRRRGDCADIELLAAMGRHDPATLAQRLDRLKPLGMTPIGDSLRLAAAQVPATAESADIIVITDGLETCKADPCAVAAEIAQQGIAIRAHVVGFGLDEQQAAALACVPDQTGGQLLRPQSGAELASALQRITRTPPEPATDSPPERLPQHFSFADTGTGTPRGLMTWRATSDGQIIEIGTTDGVRESLEGIGAALPGGVWTITAEGAEGRAEATLDLSACCGRHAVPFTGAVFAATIPPVAQVQAGMAARLPYTITHAGSGHLGGTPYKVIATGPTGSLAADQIVLRDLITRRELRTYGGATGSLAPGSYRLVIALNRDGRYEIVAERPFEAVDAPVVRIVGPDRAAPGQSIELSLDGGYATQYVFQVVDADDRTIGRGSALYQQAGGALSLTLRMPDREGEFDIVVRNGDEIVARKRIQLATAAPGARP